MPKSLNDYLTLKIPYCELKIIYKFIKVFLLCFWVTNSVAQTENPFALGGNNILPNAAFTIQSNPTEDLESKIKLGALFKKQIGVNGIANNGLAGSFKIKNYVLGLDFWQQGTSNLNRQNVKILCGLKAAKNLQIGIETGLNRINQAQELPNRIRLNAAGYAKLTMSKLVKTYFKIGLRENVILQNKETGYGGIGIMYSSNSIVKIGGYTEMEDNGNIIYGLQLNYIPIKHTEIQLNVANNSIPISLQFTLMKKNWFPTFVYQYHTRLGSQISLGLEWKVK